MIKKLNILLLLLTIFTIGCTAEIAPPEFGIFDNIPIINVTGPVGDEITTISNFEWEKIEDKVEIEVTIDETNSSIIKFPIEVLILFTEEINISNSANTIINKNAAKYMWDSTLSNGTPGNVSFSDDFKEVVIPHDRILYKYNDYDTEPTPQLSPGTYYWVVIAYSQFGEVVRASKQISFTYEP